MNKQINVNWELPEAIMNRLGTSGPGRQRMMMEEGHLLLILHELPKETDHNRTGVYFWRSPQGEWKSSKGGGGIPSLKTLLKEYQEAEERLESQFNDSKTAQDKFGILNELSPILRASKNLYNVLQSAREALREAIQLIDLRDESYEIQRSLDLLYTEVKNSIDFEIARQAELQAKLSYQAIQSSHRLNTLAAIFFPLMTVTSVFGMSMDNGISKSSWFFWLIIASGMVLGLFTIIWVLRPARHRS